MYLSSAVLAAHAGLRSVECMVTDQDTIILPCGLRSSMIDMVNDKDMEASKNGSVANPSNMLALAIVQIPPEAAGVDDRMEPVTSAQPSNSSATQS